MERAELTMPLFLLEKSDLPLGEGSMLATSGGWTIRQYALNTWMVLGPCPEHLSPPGVILYFMDQARWSVREWRDRFVAPHWGDLGLCETLPEAYELAKRAFTDLIPTAVADDTVLRLQRSAWRAVERAGIRSRHHR
jgi:hypothetical protein